MRGKWYCAKQRQDKTTHDKTRHTLCASLRSRNAFQHVTRSTLYGNLQVKCCRPEWAQNADTNFVRACAVEMQVSISQEALYMEIYRKNAAAQLDPRSATRTVCEPAQSKCTSTFQKSNFIRKVTGKMPKVRTSPQRGHTFCASLRSRSARQHAGRAALYGNLQGKCRGPAGATTRCVSLKCTSTFKKSHFIQKFTGTMPQTRINPERGHTFCASLRSGNARQHFTRGTLYENLQEKCCGPAGAPWSSTGLYNYRKKNSWVWAHCLGKKHCKTVHNAYISALPWHSKKFQAQ